MTSIITALEAHKGKMRVKDLLVFTGIPRRTLARHLAALEASGRITREYTTGTTYRGGRHVVVLVPEEQGLDGAQAVPALDLSGGEGEDGVPE